MSLVFLDTLACISMMIALIALLFIGTAFMDQPGMHSEEVYIEARHGKP